MKKLLLAVMVMISAIAVNAQTSPADSLQHYVGKYKFPSGSPVAETNVHIKEGVLYATSDMGETELTKTTVADVFGVAAYSGIATFKRNAEGKVTGVTIEVGDMVLEGTKQNPQLAFTPLTLRRK